MKPFLVILLSVGICYSYGQNTAEIADTPVVSQIQPAFSQQEFGDRFCVLALSEENYDYYAIDLTKLGGSFERVYFMNLSYEEPKIINLDGDLEKDQTWFKVYYTQSENDITCLFNELLVKTEKSSREMTAEQKSAWMTKYNKFNKIKGDE
jgi:hypothetical protein